MSLKPARSTRGSFRRARTVTQRIPVSRKKKEGRKEGRREGRKEVRKERRKEGRK